MGDFFEPSKPIGNVVLSLFATIGAASILAIAAWLLGPLKWPFRKKRLKKLILGNRKFRFIYNPLANKSKIVTFSQNGEVKEGQNNNENRWQIRRGKLELLNSENNLYSRFVYEAKSGRLTHTNDPECLSILGQYFEPLNEKTFEDGRTSG
jgi:hypothetical protein